MNIRSYIYFFWFMLGVRWCLCWMGAPVKVTQTKGLWRFGASQLLGFLGLKWSSFPKHSPPNDHKPAPATIPPNVLGVDEEAWRKMINIYNQTKGWLSAVIIWLSAWIQPRRPVVSKFSRRTHLSQFDRVTECHAPRVMPHFRDSHANKP